MQPGIYMKTEPEGSTKYLQVKDINPEYGLDYSQIAMVEDTGISGRHLLRKDDLLFAAKGASNYCVLYDGSESKIIASSSFIIIRLLTEKILPEYLCCYLNTPTILEGLKSSSVGTGIQMIPQSVLAGIELDIPSLKVQRHVVRINQLRREGEYIQREISELKCRLQDQLIMNSFK